MDILFCVFLIVSGSFKGLVNFRKVLSFSNDAF